MFRKRVPDIHLMKRVVITGMGVISPVGNNIETFWNRIKSGEHGISFIESFDTSDIDVKVAAEIKDFDPTQYIEKKEARRTDRYCQFAVAAALEALRPGLTITVYAVALLSAAASAACRPWRMSTVNLWKKVRGEFPSSLFR